MGVGVRRHRRAPHAGPVEIHGVLTAIRLGPDGLEVERRAGENLVTTNGFTQIAAALVWAGIQDQAANLGIGSATFLTPLYGAVGSSSTAPAKSDTQLGAELGRATVGGAGSTPASASVAAAVSYLFYFPNPTVTWTVTEAGAFAAATSAANSGVLLDHWQFSPALTVPTTDSLILEVSLQFGP
jgi:hypothetical protein